MTLYFIVILICSVSFAEALSLREAPFGDSTDWIKTPICRNPECLSCMSWKSLLRLNDTYLPDLYETLLAHKEIKHRNKTCTKSKCLCTDTKIYLELVGENETVYESLNEPVKCVKRNSCFKSKSGKCPNPKLKEKSTDNNCFSFQYENSTKRQSTLCPPTIDFIDGCFKAEVPSGVNIFLLWTKRDKSGFILINDNADYCIDKSVLTTTGILSVDYYCDKTLMKTLSIEINGNDYCTIKECNFICIDYITHYLCYSLATQVFMGISFCISALLLAILLVYLIYKCCYISQCHTNTAIKIMEYQAKWDNYQKEKALQKEQSKFTPVDIKELEDDGLIEMDEIKPNPKVDIGTAKSTGPGIPLVMSMILICLVCQANAECISYSVVDSSISSCLNNKRIVTCGIKVNTFAQIRNLGQSICLSFTDANQVVIGNLSVTYTSSMITAPLRFKYWTTDYEIAAASISYCPGTHSLCSDGTCSCVSPTDITGFPPQIRDYAGWTICASRSGCAANGCVVCSDQEDKGRIYMIPKGRASYVNSIIEIVSTPEITITLCFNNSCISKSDFLDNPLITDEGIQVSLTGLGARKSSIDFQELNVVGDYHFHWLYPFSPRGLTVKGTPGDVQSDFHNWIEQPPYYWAFSQDPPDWKDSEGTILVAPLESGLSIARRNGLQLPGLYNGIYWDIDANGLHGLDPNPGALSIFINTPEELRITFIETSVCPKIISLKGNGCFNCLAGASLVIESYSQCDEGSSTLSYSSENFVLFYQNSLFLHKTITNQTIAFESKQKIIDISITLRSGSNMDTLATRIVLEDPPLLDYFRENYTKSNGTELDGNNLFLDWWNGLNGPMAVAKWVIVTIILVIVSIVIFGFIYSVYRVVWSANFVYSSIGANEPNES